MGVPFRSESCNSGTVVQTLKGIRCKERCKETILSMTNFGISFSLIKGITVINGVTSKSWSLLMSHKR